MSTAAPILEARGLVKRYGQVVALDGADFELYPGEILAIIGDNGAGKSTLIKALSGALQPDEGEIRLDGEPVHFRSPRDAAAPGSRRSTRTSPSRRRSTSPPTSSSAASSGDAARSAAGCGMLDKRRDAPRGGAAASPSSRSASSRWRRPVENLSGGQRQGVAVARAATWARRLVIMDEPTAALGVKETRPGARPDPARPRARPAVILISHDMPHVFELADRIHIMRLGRRIAVVTPQTHTMPEAVAIMTGATRSELERVLDDRSPQPIPDRNADRLAPAMTYVPAADRYDRMQYRRSGRSGLQLPAVSLGLWHNFGHDRPWENGRAIVRRAFDLGIIHHDLANNYGPPYGSAEENYGRIFRHDLQPYRDELVISTKAGYDMWPGPYGEGAAPQVSPREPRSVARAGWASSTSTSSTRTASIRTRRSRRRSAPSTPR